MKCKHCGRLLIAPHYQTHAEGNYRGKMRCDPEDSGLPYGYNAAPDAVVTVEMIADLLARELDGNDGDDLGSAHGEGALHLALDFPIREAIEDVYADCGDSDPRVLSTNIAKRLAYLLPPAVLALLRGGEGRCRDCSRPAPARDMLCRNCLAKSEVGG